LTGSIANELKVMLASWSVAVTQLSPPSVVFQTPPETPETYMMSGFSGSMTKPRTRPPMLPGPRNSHAGSFELAPPVMELAVRKGSVAELRTREWRGMRSRCCWALSYARMGLIEGSSGWRLAR